MPGRPETDGRHRIADAADDDVLTIRTLFKPNRPIPGWPK